MPEFSARTISLQYPQMLEQPACRRCGGFLIPEELVEFLCDTGPVRLPVHRCLQCGAHTDPIVLLNRSLQDNGGSHQRSRARHRKKIHSLCSTTTGEKTTPKAGAA